MHKTCRLAFVCAVSLSACHSDYEGAVEAGIHPESGEQPPQQDIEIETQHEVVEFEQSIEDAQVDDIGTNPTGWLIPVKGVAVEDLREDWGDPRSGNRTHEGLDILAPQGTPVIAAADSVVEKKFLSERGGITLYLAVQDEAFIHYYAHMKGYAEGIEEGMKVSAGTVVGYVGATGNASPHAPHLHFEVHEMVDTDDWWRGTAINPYDLFAERE